MQFEKGANIVDNSGEKIAEIARVVIDPNNGQVTHLIVSKGFLFPVEKVIPIDWVDTGTGDEIRLSHPVDDVSRFPDYIEAHYVSLDSDELERRNYPSNAAEPTMWYPAVGATPMMWTGGYMGYYPPDSIVPVETTENIPEGTVALQEGAKVVDRQGEKVGDVAEIITSRQDNKVTHLVVTKGLFDQKRKLIPANWISHIKEDGVRLSVEAGFVDRLRDYNKD